jgi:hypothetical protein
MRRLLKESSSSFDECFDELYNFIIKYEDDIKRKMKDLKEYFIQLDEENGTDCETRAEDVIKAVEHTSEVFDKLSDKVWQ